MTQILRGWRADWRRAFRAAGCALLLAVGAAEASVFTFATPPGAAFSNKSVEAQAIFEIGPSLARPGGYQIAVTLLNLQSDPTGVVQAISGVAFTLSGVGSGALEGTLGSSMAQSFAIDSGGKPSAPVGLTATNWAVESVGPGQLISVPAAGLFLCRICRSSGGPTELVLGGPGEDDLYSTKGAGSITDNPAHNLFLLGSGESYAPTFVIDSPVITPDTKVETVTFAFGTAYGRNQTPGDVAVPEPAAVLCTAGGLILFGLKLRRRRPSQ